MATQRTSFEPGLAVSTVFDQIGPLQEQLAQIAVVLEPIQQLSELASVFEPLREFEGRIRDLAKVVAPMHNFQHQLQQVLKQFSPLETLDQELSQLCSSFRESLGQLATALEPAAALQDRSEERRVGKECR